MSAALSSSFAAQGLSSTEVEKRRAQGLGNKAPIKSSRTATSILAENLFSLTNTILLGIMVVLVFIGKPGDGFVTGGIVIANIILGVAQEFRAKRKLDRIALLARPKVMVMRDGQERRIDPGDIVAGDALVIRPGDQIVVDGRLITPKRVDIDEALLTGESDSVPKEQGDELLSGSFCVSGSGVYVAEKVGKNSFAYQLTSGARQYRRVFTPLQHQVSILVRLLVSLAITLTILIFLSFAINEESFQESAQSAAVVISLVPQGVLLMITVAYALGATRMAFKGALVQQINAVESLSNVDVLCLDKTGTLTTNRIMLRQIIPIQTDEAALQQRLGDFVASTGRINRTAEAIAAVYPGQAQPTTVDIPFSSEYKWSGASFGGTGTMQGSYILGAPEILLPHAVEGRLLESQAEEWTRSGLRVLLFAHHDEPLAPATSPPRLPENLIPLGWLTFSDELRPNAKDVLGQFRQAGVQLKLISGDNPQTVVSLARLAGFDQDLEIVSGLQLAEMPDPQWVEAVDRATIFGRITPEQKQRIIQILRAQGHYVAMIGDGVNDVLSLKQAQMGIAMESGSQATRAVADMVLLNDQFNVLPEAILEGQRILNGMLDVIRLFLTRTLYAILLIVIAGFIGAQFPITPKHNALLTTLPVGMPALVLTLFARPGGHPPKNLLVSAANFVVPAGLSIAAVTLAVYLLYNDQSPDLQRTMLTTTAMLCGLLLVVFAAQSWEISPRWKVSVRRVLIVTGMAGLYCFYFIFHPTRRFFELSTLGWQDLGLTLIAVAVWAVTVHVLWRYDVFRRLLIPSV